MAVEERNWGGRRDKRSEDELRSQWEWKNNMSLGGIHCSSLGGFHVSKRAWFCVLSAK